MSTLAAFKDIMTSQYWYIYDLALLGIICVSLFLLRLLKKKSLIEELGRNLNKSIRLIKSTKTALGNKRYLKKRLKLYNAKNLLAYSETRIHQIIDEEETFELKQALGEIKEAIYKLDLMIHSIKTLPLEKYNELIDTLVASFDDEIEVIKKVIAYKYKDKNIKKPVDLEYRKFSFSEIKDLFLRKRNYEVSAQEGAVADQTAAKENAVSQDNQTKDAAALIYMSAVAQKLSENQKGDKGKGKD